MNRFLRLFVRSIAPRDRAWTLDHDGGVVVNISGLKRSGVLATQIQGLQDLEKLIAEERKHVPSEPIGH